MSTRYKEESELFRDAVRIQNACNLSGVVGTLADMLVFLPGDEVSRRKHPAVCAVLYKIMDMMDVCENGSYLYDKYLECERRKDRND